jgi:hypothetical protein
LSPENGTPPTRHDYAVVFLTPPSCPMRKPSVRGVFAEDMIIDSKDCYSHAAPLQPARHIVADAQRATRHAAAIFTVHRCSPTLRGVRVMLSTSRAHRATLCRYERRVLPVRVHDRKASHLRHGAGVIAGAQNPIDPMSAGSTKAWC